MCGISGVFNYRTSEPIDGAVLPAMLETIRHRGPDDEGVWSRNDIALGMRRLSIIDLDGGKQPIWNEDHSVVIVFNGEIYNYRELMNGLRARGHQFRSASDGEVIVHLYEELGDDCVRELRGMFGFAIWDLRRHRLLIARDRLGIKPVYYADPGGRLIFASEIKALFAHPAVEPRADLAALGDFLLLKYVPAPATMFEGIRALPPGHVLTCGRDGVTVRRYWDLSFSRAGLAPRSERECAAELESVLREAVKLHLMSDVPFGAFLSGGLDSSIIVALMSQTLGRGVKTFSVGFEADAAGYSELPYARLVAERYGTDHHECIVTAADMIELAPKVVWHLDQPIADQACLANYMVARLAARSVKMVLTGEGGDELFAGYARYAGEKVQRWLDFVPPFARHATQHLLGGLPGLRRVKLAAYAWLQPDEIKRLANWFPLFNSEAIPMLLAPGLGSQIDPIATEAVIANQLSSTDASDPLSRMLYLDTKLWLPDDLLARGDKTSMAASLEARVPLLDHKVVEFAASLPPQMKLRGLTRKYLLREIAKPLLPPQIISRKKKGFPMPIAVWLRKQARPFMRDLLSECSVRERGLFSPRQVEKLMADHEKGIADNATQIWALISLELWQRQFIDAARPARLQVSA